MAAEPRRLGRRYLVDDAPYALRLLAGSALARLGPTASTATPARKRAVQVLSAGVGRLTRRAGSAAMFHGVQSPCQLPIARTSSRATSYRPVVIAASRAAAGPSGNRSTRAHSVDQKATVRKGYRPDLVDTSHGGHRAFERTVVVPPAPSVDRQRGLDENLQMVPKSTVDGSRDEDFWEVRVREAAQCCGLRPDQPPGQLVEPYLGEAEQAAVAPEQLQDRLAVEEPVFSGWKRLLKGGIDCLGAVVAILLLAPALPSGCRVPVPSCTGRCALDEGAGTRCSSSGACSTTQTFACQTFNGSTRAMAPS